MPKLPVVSGKAFFRLLVKYGCQLVSIRGSHHKVFNPITNKTSVVVIHAGQDVDRGTFTSVLSQLGIDVSEFLGFIQNS